MISQHHSDECDTTFCNMLQPIHCLSAHDQFAPIRTIFTQHDNSHGGNHLTYDRPCRDRYPLHTYRDFFSLSMSLSPNILIPERAVWAGGVTNLRQARFLKTAPHNTADGRHLSESLHSSHSPDRYGSWMVPGAAVLKTF